MVFRVRVVSLWVEILSAEPFANFFEKNFLRSLKSGFLKQHGLA